jgi:hypothetical protein
MRLLASIASDSPPSTLTAPPTLCRDEPAIHSPRVKRYPTCACIVNSGSCERVLVPMNAPLSVNSHTPTFPSKNTRPARWETPNCGLNVQRWEPRLRSLAGSYCPRGTPIRSVAPTIVFGRKVPNASGLRAGAPTKNTANRSTGSPNPVREAVWDVRSTSPSQSPTTNGTATSTRPAMPNTPIEREEARLRPWMSAVASSIGMVLSNSTAPWENW